MEKQNSFFSFPQSPFYLLLLLSFFAITGCEKEDLPDGEELTTELNREAAAGKANTFYGPAEPFNNGVTRAMVTMSRDGTPVAIGVRISEKVLEDLPMDHQVITLRLPNKAEGMPFNHIDLDWNPHGHEPEMFYGDKHFDFHFYMISPEEKMQITDPVKGEIYPAPEYVPEGYFTPGGLVPHMGVHWLSQTAPELPPTMEDFTHTFLYGSYDGEFVFMEPMITLEYLLQADGEVFPIPQPQEFQQEGYYPTNYSMSYDPVRKEYSVILSGMVLR